VVIESGPPSITAKVTSGAFDESYTIAVEALGTGDYEFNIDDGPWQTSPVFEGIALGEHLFTARNIFGCGQSSVSLMVMDYPVFFTPNNDGYNDVWRVPGLKNLLRAEVNIYDRYGKLIKTLVANSEGWDGAFNGKNLPTDDYWFTITYFEPKDGQMKTFNSHFTLKR